MTTRGITVLAGGLKETQEITRRAEVAGFDGIVFESFTQLSQELQRRGVLTE